MFVLSLKSSKLKLAAIVLVAALAVAALFWLARSDEPAVNDGGISLKASTAAERIAFLSQFGWDVDEDPVEVAEVIIPAEFDDAYEMYNGIQKSQNLDLLPYAGKRAKRWTYTVNNYPGYEDRKGIVQANLLVYEGAVIGGDICFVEPEGFMQNIEFPTNTKRNPAANNTATNAAANTTANTPTTGN